MATGDLLSATILATGWELELKFEGLGTGGAYAFGAIDTNVSNAKVVLTVVSEGYSASGSLTTITRTVYGTRQRMKAYPNQATAQETTSGSDVIVTIALSDYVYDDDKNGGAGTSGTNPTISLLSGVYTQGSASNAATGFAVTNNSTRDYPKVVGRWATVPYQVFTGTFDLEAVCFHRFAQNAKPVAVVKFNDGTTDTFVTSMVKSSKADSLPCYKKTITASDYTDNSVVTCNFTAYPWVGDANSVLTSVGGAGGLVLGPLPLVADPDDDYQKYVAVVDATSGNDGTGVVSTTYATALANPFQHIRNAAAALTTQMSGDGGGGTIYLLAGSHDTFGSGSVAAANAWVTVTRAPGASKVGTYIAPTTSTTYTGTPKLRLYDISFKPVTNGYFGSSGTGYYLWMDNVDTICASQVTTQAYGEHELAYYTFCTSDKYSKPFCENGISHIAALIRGCTVTNGATFNVAAGFGPRCVLTTSLDHANALSGRFVDISAINSVIAYCKDLANPNTGNSSIGCQTPSSDIAIVCNLVEKTANTSSALSIYDDGNTQACDNIILWHNTVSGERTNTGYGETANVARSNFSVKFNACQWLPTKHDVFGTNGAYIGAWSVTYGVGWMGNHSEQNPDNFAPYYFGIRSTRVGTAGYTNDQSLTAAGAGGGDYRPTGASVLLGKIPSAADLVIPYDIRGTAYVSGGAAGAYEYSAPGAPPFLTRLGSRRVKVAA